MFSCVFSKIRRYQWNTIIWNDVGRLSVQAALSLVERERETRRLRVSELPLWFSHPQHPPIQPPPSHRTVTSFLISLTTKFSLSPVGVIHIRGDPNFTSRREENTLHVRPRVDDVIREGWKDHAENNPLYTWIWASGVYLHEGKQCVPPCEVFYLKKKKKMREVKNFFFTQIKRN